MFNLIEKHRKGVMIGIFILIIPPFAFFGIDSYFQKGAGADVVATVGDYKVSQGEFAMALRERQEMLQRMSGGRVDPAMLDSTELRFSVVDNLVQQRLLMDRAVRAGLVITDRQVQDIVGNVEAFRENGKFSYARYEELLKGQGMTPVIFEQRMRQDLLVDHVTHAYTASAFVSRAEAALLQRISDQQREISHFVLSAERFVPQVKLEADAAKKYYDSHQDEFRVPEQVRIEFVSLSADSLLAQMQPPAAEVRKAYDDNLKRFEVKEARQASHILITPDAGGGADAKKKARARAEELYAQLKKNPRDFAELAKKYSQDPGSATNGGDLGFFERGAMVKAFDDAVFSMKAGEISAPVESEFGYHIIRLTAVRGGKGKTFEEARPEIETELKKQLAGRKFAELAEAFSNTLFEQSDSLKAAAELVKAAPQKSGWITRNSVDNSMPGNQKLLQAVFSEDVLKNKRNTEAIEVAPGVLVGARVAEYKPATIQPFDQVSGALQKKLTLQQAGQLAAQEGRAKLEALKQGKEAQVTWSAPLLAGRGDPKGIPVEVLRQAFKTDVSKLPAYAGTETPGGGYTLLRISKVQESTESARDKQNTIAQTLRQVAGQAELAAYLASLKQKSEVKIRKEAIEKK
ncbi:MAG: SurA N-terminal domain-containing protein [Burkholderiales bacterium]|nr:SurA N-terminal domain-containing protein [Burkholderiales bacterium]